jgi:MFS transporter, FHS family, L-fucose permease
MASVGHSDQVLEATRDSSSNYSLPLALMVSLFFLFGFTTVLNDILIPHLKGLFSLTQTEAMLVQFCFFGAYFIMSLPAGWIINKVGYKRGLVLALAIVAFGMLLFIPASMVVSYPFFLFALFVVGSGITVLQVAANPYISVLGKPETASSRLNLAGGFNSLATTIGPLIGAAFIFIDDTASNEAKAESVRGPYMGLAIFVLLLAVFFSIVKLPELIPTNSNSKSEKGRGAWGYRHLVFGAGAIFFYVGAEVAIGSILIDYLKSEQMGALDRSLAANFVSYYWGGAMIGRFIGFGVLQKIRAEKGLAFVSICAIVLIILSMTGFALSNWVTLPAVNISNLASIKEAVTVTVPIAAIFIVLVGLCNAIMWPAIFPLSIAGLGKDTSQGSGILVMMVVGGAIIPVIQGLIVDITHNYPASFLIVLLCYAYILFFALTGHKNVNINVE